MAGDDEEARKKMEAHAKRGRQEDFTVFDCNWRAWDVFCKCSTQWKYAPGGGLQALNYGSLSAVMEMMDIPRKKRNDTFNRVRMIEIGVINAFAQHKERTANGR